MTSGINTTLCEVCEEQPITVGTTCDNSYCQEVAERNPDIITEGEPWAPLLTPTEYQLTKEKLDKINARAVKRGFTGRFELHAERVVTTRSILDDFEVEQVFYKCSISGDAPKYNGWTFCARVDALEGGTFTLATAPKAPKIDRVLIEVGKCDHCSTKRPRKVTYVVKNELTGAVLNVGSSCLKDFLGHDARFVWLHTPDVEEELKGSYGTYVAPTYTVESILAVAYAVIRVFGWVSSTSVYQGNGGTSTKAHVSVVLNDHYVDAEERAEYEPVRRYAEEALGKVPAMIEWVKSLDGSKSDFNANLLACLDADAVTRQQLGILAYVPQGYLKSLQQAVERQAVASVAKTSEFIGTVGERVEITGTLSSVKFIEGNFGTTALYTILTEQGLVKWFASGDLLGDETGRTVKLKGTVKKHETFRDVKSTVLTRCKEISI